MLNIKFDKIWVLSLKEEVVRRKNITKIFNDRNISFTFFDAVNGNNKIYLDKFNEYYQRPYDHIDSHFYEKLYQRKCIRTPGTWGILESYKKMILKAKELNLENFFCFQDDVNLHTSFDSALKKFFEIINWNKWKIIKLGASQHTWDDVCIINNFYHPPKDSDGAFAVGFHKSSYDYLLSSIDKFNCSFDSGPIQDIQELFSTECYIPYPNLAIADVTYSTTGMNRNLFSHSKKMRWKLDDYDLHNLIIPCSIIVPIYNAESTIEACVNSLINQTYANLEIILVDDCSTDLSPEICKKLEKEFLNIKFIKTEHNSGCYIARNMGIQYSSGDIIGFQDADDISFVDRIEFQVSNMIKKNVRISMCDIYRSDHLFSNKHYNNNEIIKIITGDMKKYQGKLNEWKNKFMLGSVTTLIDKNLFKKYGLYREDSQHSSDIEFIERVYCYEFNDDPLLIDNMWVFILHSKYFKNFLEYSQELKYCSVAMNKNNLTIKYDKKIRKEFLDNCKIDIKYKNILSSVRRLK